MKQQKGFTLIELIVVIVILGILAATALPRFANLQADARVATLNAARGSLASTSAMVHGSFLAAGNAPAAVTYEGVLININVVSGYPVANAALANAAGLNTDYQIIPANTAATANSPATGANDIVVIPLSVQGTPTGFTCFIRYTEATVVNTQPVITVAPAAASC